MKKVSKFLAETAFAPPVGRWELVGATAQIEINLDGSGSMLGTIWGREPVTWAASGNRLSVTVERGYGSADYVINGNNELVLSEVQGVILVAGTYTPADEQGSPQTAAW